MNGGFGDTATRLDSLEREMGLLFGYLRHEREALITSYDDVSRRLNELLTEAEWLEDSPAQLTTNQNNYEFSSDAIVYRFSTNFSRTITGFLAPISERMIVILNVGSQGLVIAHQSASSTAKNRVITATGADVTLVADASAILWYDGNSERWRQLK